jgi:hypothetical protein
MAIYYIDLVNGSDTNNGTSWALAWKTITNGATAARIAPGDEIRISKTPDPVNIGNATWTADSPTVTLATAQTLTVTLATASWTASTNITCTTSANSKVGATCASVAFGASFTTGKAAYYALGGAYNFSAYQKLSFWIQNSVALSANNLKICLCSDTIGNTIVDTFYIPAIPSPGRYLPLTIAKDGGGNLGSSIQSIAIYADVDPGTPTLLLNDFIACTTNGLCLQALISKNGNAQGGTEGYFALQSIDGTTIKLDGDTNCYASATWNKYSGATETVTTYFRHGFKTSLAANTSTNVNLINDSGTSGSYIEYQGGYEVGTTNQNGETFFDGLNGNGYGISLSSKSYNKFNYLNAIRYYYGIYFNNSSNNIITTISNANSNASYGIFFNSSNNNTITTISNANSNANYGIYFGSSNNNTITTISNANSNSSSGIYFNSSNNNTSTTISNANSNASYGVYFGSSNNNTITTISNANSNANYGVYLNSSNNNIITTISNAKSNAIYGIFLSNSSNNTIKVGSSTGATGFYSDAGINYFKNSTFNQATEFSSTSSPANNWVWSLNHDNTEGNHWGFTYQATVNRQTAVVHGTEPVAWKTAITGSTRTTAYPVKLKIAEVAFNAGSLVTVKAWVKKDHATNVACKLAAYANTSVGINTNVSATKASDTNWEELTITFTPTVAGVTEIYLESWYVSGNSNTYVGTITVTQA